MLKTTSESASKTAWNIIGSFNSFADEMKVYHLVSMESAFKQIIIKIMIIYYWIIQQFRRWDEGLSPSFDGICF